MATVYILHSKKIDKFYTGFTTESIEQRLEKHNNNYYENKWTKQGQPWAVFYILECEHLKQAQSIEMHIKKMKSKKYIDNLSQYPEMGQKLLDQYK